MHENKEHDNKFNFLIISIVFVAVICILTFTVTYAYFKVSTTKSETLATATASAECLSVSYNGSNNISLEYQYPVTDSYALSHITPVTITVTNNCTNNSAALPYTLAITSLANSSGYISDNKIRMHVKRKVGSGTESVLKPNNYLNSLTKLTSGNVYNHITSDFAKRNDVNSYSTKNIYSIDSSTLANSATNTYKVYLWVDYYEGDAGVYSGSAHNSTYDGTTEGLDFAAAISLVVNAG